MSETVSLDLSAFNPRKREYLLLEGKDIKPIRIALTGNFMGRVAQKIYGLRDGSYKLFLFNSLKGHTLLSSFEKEGNNVPTLSLPQSFVEEHGLNS